LLADASALKRAGQQAERFAAQHRGAAQRMAEAISRLI
jgi:3-deoxy-D-manno-octulosonic-acid transferase